MAAYELGPGDALIIVDVQNDFCPGGKLAVPHGDEVVAAINPWIQRARAAGSRIYASRDWHPKDHPSFHAQGGPWPEHCVQDTDGARFHPDLELPLEATVISKGVRLDKDQYSAFDATGLAHHLRAHGIERLWMAGLAQDVCVHATALSGLEAGFEVHVIRSGTRPIDDVSGRKAVDELRSAGARIEA